MNPMPANPTPPTDPDETVRVAVEKATQQAYWDWAAAHPSLAAVIDQIVITQQTASRLRDSDAYRQAVAAYRESRNERNLVNRLAELAGPILNSILGF